MRASSRRRGIATELLRRVIARAGERGFGRVSLSVNFDNPSAHLYRRLGFHETDSDTVPIQPQRPRFAAAGHVY